MTKGKVPIVPAIGIAASIAVLLLFASPLSVGGSLFSLIGQSQADSHKLEVKYMFRERLLGGDAKILPAYLQVYDDVVDTENSCEFCTYVVYTPSPGRSADLTYADIVPHDFSGSKKMTFFIMGAKGGEQVSFEVGGKEMSNNINSMDVSFAAKTGNVKLSKKWDKIEIDLSGTNLSNITHPLKINIAKQNQNDKVAFYIKHILFDTSNPVRPIPAQKQLG